MDLDFSLIFVNSHWISVKIFYELEIAIFRHISFVMNLTSLCSNSSFRHRINPGVRGHLSESTFTKIKDLKICLFLIKNKSFLTFLWHTVFGPIAWTLAFGYYFWCVDVAVMRFRFRVRLAHCRCRHGLTSWKTHPTWQDEIKWSIIYLQVDIFLSLLHENQNFQTSNYFEKLKMSIS